MSQGLNPFHSQPRVFISYARSDGGEFATSLRKRLNNEHSDLVLWQDSTQMRAGIGWWRQIEEALNAVEIIVTVMTPEVVKSDVAQREWRYARQQGVRVCPVIGPGFEALHFRALPNWMSNAHFYDLDREWEMFVIFLKSPGKENRVPFMAPNIPSHYVDRSVEYQALIDGFLDEARQSPRFPTIALQGPGGFGKTTLASKLCHDERIVSAFDDGILWMTLGESPKNQNIQNELAKLYAAVTGDRPAFVDFDDVSIQLAERLEQKNCLIVVDDVWDAYDLTPVFRGIAECARLITTRQKGIAIDIESQRIAVHKMSERQAVAMLTAGKQSSPESHSQLRAIARKLGEWPLLLKLAASQLRHQLELDDSEDSESKALVYVDSALKRRGAVAFDRSLFRDRNDAVAPCVDASLDIFSPGDQIRCAELSVFRRDKAIPVSAASGLWSLEEFDADDLLMRLNNYSLLDYEKKTASFRIHSVLRLYLESKLQDPTVVHQKLIDGWLSNPYKLPDEFAWIWIGWHLAQAKRREILQRFILDFEWISARIHATGVAPLLQDFDLLVDSQENTMLRAALRLSSHGLDFDPDQLFAQLQGRLELGQSRPIDQMLERGLQLRSGPRLTLADTSLSHPGGSLTGIVKGHSGSVEALAISPDGRWTISASADRTLRSWDLSGNQVLRTYEGHSEIIHAIAISPDSRSVLSGSEDRTLRLWDIETGKVRGVFRGHSLGIRSLAIAPCGNMAASVSEDGSVRIWDLKSGHSKRAYKGPYHQLNAILFTKDSRYIAFGAGDWTINILDLEEGELVNVLEGHVGVVQALAVTTDGHTLLSGAEDGTIRVWNLNGDANSLVLKGHTDSVDTVSITMDGKRAISGSKDRTIRVWCLEKGVTLRVLQGHSGIVRCLALGSNASIAVSGSSDQTVRIWDLDAAPLKQRRKTHNEAVSALAISADGNRAVTGSQIENLILWGMKGETSTSSDGHNLPLSSTPRMTGCLKVERPEIRALQTSADCQTVIANSGSRTLRVWSFTDNASPRVLKGHTAAILNSDVSADGTRAVSLSGDRTLRVWDLQCGQAQRVLVSKGNETLLRSMQVKRALLQDLDVDPAVYSEPQVDIAGETIAPTAKLAISQDGKYVVFGHSGNLCMWDLETGSVHYNEQVDFECALIAVDSVSRQVLAGSYFGPLIAWNFDGQARVLDGHTGEVLDVVIAPGGRQAISAARDDTIRIWDLDTSKESARISCHLGKVDIVSIAPNGAFAFLICGDTIVAYGIREAACLSSLSFDHQITALAVTPNGQSIAVGDQSGCVHFLNFE